MSAVLSIFGFLLIPQHALSQPDESRSGMDVYLREKGYLPIPLEKTLTGHLCLAAEVNDTKCKFILDTGAGGTVMDKSRAAPLELDPAVSELQGVGAGASGLPLETAIVRSFRMRDHLVEDMEIHLMDLEHINGAFRQMDMGEIDGVIGGDILSLGDAVIDYANLILYMKP